MAKGLATRTSVLLLGLTLAACGGGGSEGISSTPPPTPGGYPRMTDVVNGSYTFNTVGVSYNGLPSGFAGGGSFALGSGATIAYNAASDTFTVTAPGGLGTTFTAANLVASAPGTVRFFKNTGAVQDDVILTVPLTYAMLTVWNRTDAGGITDPLLGGGPQTTGRISIGGSQTTASDVPRTGSATYSAQLAGAAQSGGTTYNLTASTATFSANFAANTVQTSVTLGGVPLAGGSTVSNFGTFSGTGTISTTGPGFAGSLGGAGGMGIFQGAFFGPQAAEMGYGYVLQGLGFSSAGAVVGVKQ
jgi:hypothetical protein